MPGRVEDKTVIKKNNPHGSGKKRSSFTNSTRFYGALIRDSTFG